MKGLSLLFLVGSFLVFQSVRKDQDHLLISQRKKVDTGRSLASDTDGKCLRDLFNVETLKKEVAQLEDSLDTNRIEGKWRHLDLSTLPTPAAVFLKTHGDKLGDPAEPADFSSCTDVPCFYNVLYGTPDGIAGYVHYLWYLRTGVYLAADNFVPNQQSPTAGRYNGKSFPLSSYLFDEDELYGFWRLGKMLKAPHATLTYLNEIQRIPRGEGMEGNMGSACGLANSQGWITLTDKCLTVYRRGDAGYLYPSVLHEISHQLDFEEGLRFNDEFYRSEKADYLAISGFELTEYRSGNQIVRQWKLKPGYPTVTAYAKGSPAEHFAELLAYYRVDGDGTKSKVNEEALRFASSYYHGKSFEFQSLADSWADQFTSKRTKDVLKTVVNCEDADCISREISLLASGEVNRIRSEEPDGCLAFSNPLIAQRVPGKIQERLQTLAEEFQNEASPEVREKLTSEFDELLNPAAAYESFFACHSSTSECYAEEVTKRKDSEFSDYGELSDKLLSVYLWTHPYESVQKEITTFYQSILSSRDGIMKRKADELWESCKKITPTDDLPPQGSDYIVKDGYMVSSFYNCLNRGFVSMLNGTLDAVKLEEFSPQNQKEREFIMEKLRARMTSILDDKLRSERVKETKYRDAFVEQLGSWLYNSMRTNRWWVPRGRPDQAQLEAACRESAPKLIGGEIYFHLKKELYKDLIESTCKGIR